MAKKLCSYRMLSCTMALLTAITLIIACGDGTPIGIDSTDLKESDAYLLSPANMSSIVSAYLSSSSQEEQTQSSSSNVESSNSSSGGEKSSSSNEEQPSSSSEQTQSSSSEESNNSSDSQYTLTCTILPENSEFPPNVEIPVDRKPELKCTDKDGNTIDLNDEDAMWTGAPKWKTPQPGIYNISVKIDREGDSKECHGIKEECGTITITAAASSSSKASSSSVSPPSSSSTGTSSSSSKPSSSSVSPPSSSSVAPPSSSSVGGNSSCPLTGTATSITMTQPSSGNNIYDLTPGLYSITYTNENSDWVSSTNNALKCAALMDTKICDGVGEWKWVNSGWNIGNQTWTPDLLKKIHGSVSGVTESSITERKPSKILITGSAVKCEFGWF